MIVFFPEADNITLPDLYAEATSLSVQNIRLYHHWGNRTGYLESGTALGKRFYKIGQPFTYISLYILHLSIKGL